MKLKVILFGFALILFGKIQAQVSKESFEKAVDLLNCKTVELTLPNENIQQFQNDCPCKNTDVSRIVEFLKSAGKPEVTIALSKEVESLKNLYKENWKKKDVVSYLSEGVFKDKRYKKIVKFSEDRKEKTGFDEYLTNLKSDLTNTLEENLHQVTSSPTNTNVQESTFEDKIEELEELKKNISKKKDKGVLEEFTDYLILFSMVVGIIALIITLKNTNGSNNEPSNETKNYIKNKIDDAKWNKSIPNNTISSSDLKDAYKRITDLEVEVSKLKDKIFTSNSESSSDTKKTSQHYQEIKQPDFKQEIFFLSSPNSDGSFDENSGSSIYKEGATIYRFTKMGINKANFQIDEKEASIKLALQYRDKRIDPVCEATNAFNQAKHITTHQPGEAELISGKWIVNKKARIKYEN